MRTNVVVDDALMQKALLISGLKTKREVIQAAIEEFVEKREPKKQKNFLDLFGTNLITEDYDYKCMREDINIDID